MRGRKSPWSLLAVGALLMVSACGNADSSSPSADSAGVGSTIVESPSHLTATVRQDPSSGVTAPPLTASQTTSTQSEAAPSSTEPVPPLTASEPAVAQPAATPPPETAAVEPSGEEEPETNNAEPAPPPPPAAAAADVADKTVVLDPGHNGANGSHSSIINAEVDAGFGQRKPCNTTGTSTNDGYPEHAFTWAVANRVKSLLETKGINVVMTRDSDDGVGPCVNVRAAIGNDNDADAVVSLHGDGAPSGDRGFYAMTSQQLPNGAQTGAKSVQLATAVRDALIDNDLAPSNYAGSNGLFKRDDLAGLNLSMVPTTMIELGNMRDSQDAAFMASDAGQDQIAAGIADGIVAYLSN